MLAANRDHQPWTWCLYNISQLKVLYIFINHTEILVWLSKIDAAMNERRPEAEREWQMIYMLGKDSRGYLHRATVRGIYDGSVFPKLAARTATLHSKA